MNVKKLLIVPLFALLLSGCKPTSSSETPTTSESPVTSQTSELISPASINISADGGKTEIKVEETLQLTAEVLPAGAPQGVVWSSSHVERATVSEDGLVTGVDVGNVFIIATSSTNASVVKQFALKINEKDPEVILPENIVISAAGDANTVEIEGTLQLGAVVLPVEASQFVSWSSNDETKATVSSTGLVTGVALGSIIIKATSVVDVSISAEYHLAIIEKTPVEPGLDWEAMAYSNHADFVAKETVDGTPFKVKGVVTHVSPLTLEGKVNYFIQEGSDGYYIYNQDANAFPIVLGKSYDVGGFYKYYNGTNEIVDVEYLVERNDHLTMDVVNISAKDVQSLTEMAPHHASYVQIDVALLSSLPSSYTKAYTVKVMVNEKEFELRVDPTLAAPAEFEAISAKFQTAPIGSPLSVKGFMSAFGYGTPKTQLQIVKAEDLSTAELSPQDEVEAAAASIELLEAINLNKTSINLPTTLEGYSGLTMGWESNSPIIDVTTGAVIHPLITEDVTLTVTISKSTGLTERVFVITVFGTDESKLTTLHTLDLEDAGPAGQYGTSAMKGSYNVAATNNMVDAGTPVAKWQLVNTLIGGDNNDKRTGDFAMRSQSTTNQATSGRIELQDNTYTFNMIEFDAAIYGANKKGLVVMFEVSTDNGATWTPIEREITINNFELETFRIKLGTTGPTRVALIMKAGTGQRLSVDNLKLIQEVL